MSVPFLALWGGLVFGQLLTTADSLMYGSSKLMIHHFIIS